MADFGLGKKFRLSSKAGTLSIVSYAYNIKQ